MSRLRTISALLATAILAMCTVAAVYAGGSTAYYTGQGFTFDGNVWVLNDQRCGGAGEGLANDGGTGQFLNWNGPMQPYQTGQPYLVWVLTLNAANSQATLYLPDGPHQMYKVGGTLKYASKAFSYSELVTNPPSVYASYTYTGRLTGSPQLVVSHGCPPFTNEGAWCSPGFWRNARDGAWQLIGLTNETTGKAVLFNASVVPNFYATANSDANLTIGTVLTDTGGQGGANKYGAADAPFGLNAFNATGAYLTDQIPGFAFSLDAYLAAQTTTTDEACPIDNFGNFKLPE